MWESFDWVSFLGGLFSGGTVSGFLTFTLTKNIRANGGTAIDQSNARAGGNITGRDHNQK